ncbi:MAG TPA: hypothetical protein VF395_15840 [Polyangiaceae bacterium]
MGLVGSRIRKDGLPRVKKTFPSARSGKRSAKEAAVTGTIATARLFGPILVLLIQVLGSLLVGCCLLLARVRAGSFLHEAYLVFPQVGPHDRVKKLCLRLLGGVLVALAVKAALGFVHVAF